MFAAVLGGSEMPPVADGLSAYKLEQDPRHSMHDSARRTTRPTDTPSPLKFSSIRNASAEVRLIFPHTYRQVRDFAPKLATALNRVLVSDVIGHRIDNGSLVPVRQLFQG